MPVKNTIHICLCCLLVFACFVPAISQKKVVAGMNVNSDYYSDAIRPSIGLTLETQLTKHSGLETGIFYRADRFHISLYISDSTGPGIYPLVISQRFVNIPLLYKYYSKSLNISAGPLLDIYTGWRQVTPKSGAAINYFNVHPALRIGFLGKVSKTFIVSKKVFLEPEIRIGFLRNSDELGVGIGVAAKYQF